VRKPRDYDAELKALNDRARQLKERKVHQLGDLVITTGADNLTIEQLAGLLLTGTENKDASAKEKWRQRGEAFFRREQGNTGGGGHGNNEGAAKNNGGAPPAGSQPRQN